MKPKQSPSLTIAEIFEKYIGEYTKTHSLPLQQKKVVNDILGCQTQKCGMHTTVCTGCGNIDFSYNSCRNRHCPNCQNAQKQKWIGQRKNELLPVSYFHLVFTVPHQLNPVFIANKALCYGLLFENVWKTINHFSVSPKWLGAKTGCIALLHSWGQNLSFHPHIHCIMPAGGLTEDGMEWLHTHPTFFAPVKEISKKFKELFLEALKLEKSNLKPELLSDEWDALIKALEKTNWVVFSQPSFAKPDYVLDYLGNYTHKIAISNYRLIKLEDDHVFFRWKDYKENGKEKIMRLPVFEFMRRFLEHVLPYNFYKIRYYGIFSNRYKSDNIENARQCLSKEDKTVNMVEVNLEDIENLPEGCKFMGVCKECGGATISMYHYRLSQLAKKPKNELLRQTG
jgi:hypothetical protein